MSSEVQKSHDALIVEIDRLHNDFLFMKLSLTYLRHRCQERIPCCICLRFLLLRSLFAACLRELEYGMLSNSKSGAFRKSCLLHLAERAPQVLSAMNLAKSAGRSMFKIPPANKCGDCSASSLSARMVCIPDASYRPTQNSSTARAVSSFDIEPPLFDSAIVFLFKKNCFIGFKKLLIFESPGA